VARLIAEKNFNAALDYVRKHDMERNADSIGIDAQGVLKAKMAFILEKLNSSYFEKDDSVAISQDHDIHGDNTHDESSNQSYALDTVDIFSSLDQIEVRQGDCRLRFFV
jgi:hypothetical protein